MLIHSVTLKNFKTHRDRHFTFAPGTNAICGENGAGKTSLLEAIAWVLFNYRGNYTKDDLIRNGSTSAEVMVEFTSNADGLPYVVRRHSTTGYKLFDPRLGETLAYTTQDQVLPWLREHLGVPPGTDLGELFRRTVGVPQGTFTVDFLQSPTQRRAVFDKILKVEAYRTAYKDLNGLQKYAAAQGEAIARDIGHWQERLEGWEEVRQRHQGVTQALQGDEAQIQTLGAQLQTLTTELETLKAQAQTVQTLGAEQQRLQGELTAHRQALTLQTQALDQGTAAVACCDRTLGDYQAYQAAEAALTTLTLTQQERQQLQRHHQALHQALETRAADCTRLQVQIEGGKQGIAAMAALKPLVAQQQQLQARYQDLQQQQQALAQTRGTLAALTRQQTTLQQQQQQTQATLDRLVALVPSLEQVPEWERQRDRLQQQRSRIEAARQFQGELQRLVTTSQGECDRYQVQAIQALEALETLQASAPLLSATALTSVQTALQAGITLTQDMITTLEGILGDLADQTNAETLETQLAKVHQHLANLAQTQAQVSTLPQHQQRLADLQAEAEALNQQIQPLEHALTQGETLAPALAAIQQELTALDNPQGRLALLTRQSQDLPTWEAQYAELQAAQGEIQAQITAISTKIAAFGNLEEEIAQQTQRRQAHQPGYQQYLQHQRLAQEQPRLQAAVAQAQAAVTAGEEALATITTQWQAAQAAYDPHSLEQRQTLYAELRSERDRLAGGMPDKRRLQGELQQQLTDLEAIAARQQQAMADKEQCDRNLRFIQFARSTYQEAGPRITERYVQQVSREADRLFRELLNRQNVALTWTRDYDIQVQEGADTRRFINLSGGEQMCAALAVRLALLKVVAAIDIAFFDEPTTNLDRPRRERLAEAISRIRSFNQLFVISHDDTFETVTENVIIVDRQP